MKRIIVFSDGTGNSSAKLFRTNVWRLYDALDRRDQASQVAYYDNGVGTASFKPLAILGGAFGVGLKRNVLDIYRFICRNYEPGDEIQAFGFSRGAFTIRVLLGLIRRQGLVPYAGDERDLVRQATWAYRRYRRQAAPATGLVGPLRWARDLILGVFDRRRGLPDAGGSAKPVVPPIAFVGLWDSVAAYGFPVVELTRAWDQWIWPLGLPSRELSPNVVKACHALALDDERQTFHPLLWNEANEPTVHNSVDIADERVSQVWFSGMHSNVGGGYPDDGMAYDSLCWIAGHAVASGLVLRPGILDEWCSRCTPSSPMFDSRSGAGAYYRYLPRPVDLLSHDEENEVEIARPKIHTSVFDRIGLGGQGYAPIGLPRHYAITDGQRVFAPPASPAQAQARIVAQEQVWDAVWYRRISYFLTVVATLFVASLPWTSQLPSLSNLLPWSLPTLAGVVGTLRGFVPDFLGAWLDHFTLYPAQLLVGAIVIVGLMGFSAWVEHRASDTMRRGWHGEPARPRGVWLRLSNWIRTKPAYIAFIDFLRYRLAPHGLGLPLLVILILAGLVLTVRVSFDVPMLTGRVCRNPTGQAITPGTSISLLAVFDSKNPCQAMGVVLERNVTYEITVSPTQLDWLDDTIPVTGLEGFESHGKFWAFAPLRRHKSINWFVPIARVGSHGDEFYPITKSPTLVRPQVGGQLFMYVNDALSFYPSTFFYNNNHGDADTNGRPRFSIRRMTDEELRR